MILCILRSIQRAVKNMILIKTIIGVTNPQLNNRMCCTIHQKLVDSSRRSSTNDFRNNGQVIRPAFTDTSTASHDLCAIHSTSPIAPTISRPNMRKQKKHSSGNSRFLSELRHRSSRLHQTWEHRSLCDGTRL